MASALTYTDEDIVARLPHAVPRPGQAEAIRFILDSFAAGKKFVFLEAPTGAGKSAIGLTVADFYDRSYYLTIQKILQSQISRDYAGSQMIDLRGRNAYPCTFYQIFGPGLVQAGKWTQEQLDKQLARGARCDDGYCHRQLERFKCKSCFPPVIDKAAGLVDERWLRRMGVQHSACPYYEQVGRAQESRKVLMNFSSFLYQTGFTDRFGARDLLIIDECLHPHTKIVTNLGIIPIGTIVNQRIHCQVLSYNTTTGMMEYKPIIRWLRRNQRQTYKVLAGNKVFYATEDHKIYTPGGMVRLCDLKVGDQVLTPNYEVTPAQRQLLLGSLLGDANIDLIESKRISKKHVNKGQRARVRFRHSPKQFRYIDWKYRLLTGHVRSEPRTTKSAGFTKLIRSFSTGNHLLTDIAIVLRDGTKRPNIDWLNQLDDLGMAVWFMDDGSQSNDVVHFHTEGYTFEDNAVIAQWLLAHGYPARVLSYMKRGRTLYYISIGRDGGRLLASRIARFVPEYMRYKLPSGRWDAYDANVERQEPKAGRPQPILLIETYKETITYDIEVADNHNFVAGNAIVSNCHHCEEQLMDFVSVSMSDRDLAGVGLQLPDFDEAVEYAIWLIDNNVIALLTDMIEEARKGSNLRKVEELIYTVKRLTRFLKCIEDGMTDWVHELKTHPGGGNAPPYRTITMKPVFVPHFADELLWSYGNKILMMSATILSASVMAKALGIDKDDMAFYRMPNSFPVNNRPIFVIPALRASGGKDNQHTWGAAMVKWVDGIVRKYRGQRGIVHTHNFAIANMLIRKCRERDRFLFQESFRDKTEMLEVHAARSDSVLVAPAMHEGLDLHGDLSRFQIICKTPWPNFFDDKQLAARVENDRRYLIWLVALRLVQAYGRSIRSAEDWAHTYIIDGAVNRFLAEADKMLPFWFKEAIIKVPL